MGTALLIWKLVSHRNKYRADREFQTPEKQWFLFIERTLGTSTHARKLAQVTKPTKSTS